MVKYRLTVILKAHEYTNPVVVSWVTADQPLFAFLKTIQWSFLDTDGEHKPCSLHKMDSCKYM